jgi:hypothetical protein
MRRSAYMLAVLLCGCATEAGYERMLQSWVGKSERALVAQWGVPHGFYEAGGTRYLTYTNSRVALAGNTDPIAVNLRCRTTFEVQGGTVARWQWQGNDCVN